jgi:hypothetical protein
MRTPKQAPRQLRLKRETLRVLSADDLAAVAGGFIMKDSVIVRTSGRVALPETMNVQPERP